MKRYIFVSLFIIISLCLTNLWSYDIEDSVKAICERLTVISNTNDKAIAVGHIFDIKEQKTVFGNYLTDLIQGELIQIAEQKKFNILKNEEIIPVLSEKKIEFGYDIEGDQAVKIGNALNVEFILYGQYDHKLKKEDKKKVKLRLNLINVKTGKILISAEERVHKTKKVKKLLKKKNND